MARRLKPLVPLEGDQRLASSPADHAALAASAGTGKTHVLTARVLRLLLSGADPSSILCLTFTKAGAAEMAHRIHSRLAYWVRLRDADLNKELFALDEHRRPDALNEARRLFARVLDAPGGGIRIQTIHAFAQSLLASFPAEAGLTPGFRPLEGREESLLARSTLADLLVRAEQGGDLPLIEDVRTLSLRLGERDAAGLLQACARAPDAMAALGPRPGIEPRLRHLFGLQIGDIEEVIAAQCCDELFEMEALTAIAQANAAWGSATGLGCADLVASWRTGDPARRAAGLEELVGIVRTGKGEPRKVTSGLLKAAPDYADHAARLIDCCDRLLRMRGTAESVALFAAGLRAGQEYARAYGDAKRAQGLVDFDDLIRSAEELLTTPGMGDWVRYKLDQQTDHILVDEAQDTNASQWSMVDALAGEFFAGEGRSARHRTIFTVGDFKQAIFSFQGTNPREFERAREKFSGAARALRENAEDLFNREERLPPDFLNLSMDRSFRSAPQVLEVVDRVIADLGHEALGLPHRPNPHVSHRPDLSGSVTVWQPFTAADDAEEEGGEEGWVSDTVRRYATCLARQVAAWLERPFWLEVEKRPLRPEDILILVRRRGDLAALLVARLHAEGVPVAGIDRLSLSAPLAVKDLLAAARFAIQPLDDLNLASLLVSPLLGWSQDELFEAAFDRGRAGLWPRLRARAAEGNGPDLAPLQEMLRIADFATPHEFFESLLSGPLDGRRKLLERLGSEARDPIEELLSSALDFETAGAPSLARFLDWFARGEVEIVRDPSAPLDAVRVMTVHGSKGLEAPVLVLADACADPDRLGPGGRFAKLEFDDGAVVPVPRPRKEALAEPLKSGAEAQDRREREEHWRLLYVALTRAKERLFVGGALGANAKGPPEASWFRAVEQALAGLGSVWEDDPRWRSSIAFGSKSHPRPLQQELEGSSSAQVAPLRARSAELVPSWLHDPAPTEERPPRPLAPSAIGEDEAPYPPPSPDQRRGAIRGKLLHRLFERLPGVAAGDRRRLADEWLASTGDASDPAFRASLVEDACRVIDDPRFADLFGPDALAEAPVAAVIGGGLVVSGTADRLLVTPERILVADFKTGRAVPASAAEAPTSHLRQMAAYRAALQAIFPGRPVGAALLYTAGPLLHPLPEELLDRHAPGKA
jgi:ATP-dependent helicase/nuclease subunit A